MHASAHSRPGPFPAQPGVIIRCLASVRNPFAPECQHLARLLELDGVPSRCEGIGPAAGATQPPLDPASSILLQAGPPPAFDLYRRCRRRIGRCSIPTDRIPSDWVDACRPLDEIWLPSWRHADLFAAAGVGSNRLRVLPRGVDADWLAAPPLPAAVPVQRSVCFLAFWDPAPDTGSDLALRAFLREFRDDDDVALLLQAPELAPIDLARITTAFEREFSGPAGRAPRVILRTGDGTPAGRRALYALADAVLLPCRVDCGGPLCLEAMACECPVIATNWGETGELLATGRGYPLACPRLVPVPPDTADDVCLGGRWAEPDVDSLRQHLREITRHPGDARQRARTARQRVLTHHSGEAWERQWLDALCSHLPREDETCR